MYCLYRTNGLVGILIISGMVPVISWAGEPGMRGATFLKIGAGPRATAMAESYVAIANDAYASFWNPAGLSRLESGEAAFAYNRSFQEITQSHISVALPLGPRTAVGVYNTNASVRPFDSFDADGHPTGEVDATDAVYALAVGHRATPRLRIGGAIKAIRSRLGPSEASARGYDAGLIVDLLTPSGTRPHRAFLGFATRNHGSTLTYDQRATRLPTMHDLGLGYETDIGSDRLTAAISYHVSPDHRPYLATGHEFRIRGIVALRAGYRFGSATEGGLRVGLGIRVRSLDIAYSLSPYSFLGDAHRFGVSVRFGSPASKVAANSLLNSPGMLGLPTPPPSAPAVPPPAPVPAAPKQPPPPTDADGYIGLGRQLMREGRFDDAAAAFSKALKYRPNDKAAQDLLRKALNELDRQNSDDE